jgi:hypothetical protein
MGHHHKAPSGKGESGFFVYAVKPSMHTPLVMAWLDPAIQPIRQSAQEKLDGRLKGGHDELVDG